MVQLSHTFMTARKTIVWKLFHVENCQRLSHQWDHIDISENIRNRRMGRGMKNAEVIKTSLQMLIIEYR